MKSDCYCTSLRAATRRVTALYDAALEAVGVNVAQWGLLRKLSDSVPMSIAELAAAADLERSTVARNIRVLERLGLVELGESAMDRRNATLVLSRKGTETLQHGMPHWEHAQRQFEAIVGSDAALGLRALLHDI